MKSRAIIGAVLLTGLIAGGVPAVQTARAATTVTFWSRDSDAATVTALVKAYNASQSAVQVQVTIIPAAQYVTKFGTAVAGGEGPDITAIDLIYLPAFAAANEMTDITALAKALPFYKQLSPSHTRLATYQGKQYAVPFTAEGSILMYNKDLFKQAGLDASRGPANWAAIEHDAKAITALGKGYYGWDIAGSCGGCNAFTFLPMIWASGGDIFNADGTKATITTSPQVKAALAFYHRLWTEGVVPPGAKTDNGATWTTGFLSGKVGMVSLGAFGIGALKTNPKLNFGVSYIPGQNGGWSSFAGGDSIGIPRGSHHVAEAWDFIKWCIGQSAQVNIIAKGGTVPVRTDLAANVYTKLDPRYVTAGRAMAAGRTPYSAHYNQLINDANGPWASLVYNGIFGNNLDQTLATAQAAFTKILSSPAQ